MALPEEEFIRRFLQHILPSGFRKIRYFGFMSLRFLKENLDKCVEILNKAVFLPMLEGLNALEVVSFTLNKDMTAWLNPIFIFLSLISGRKQQIKRY